MVISATGLELITELDQSGCKCTGIVHHGLSVGLEAGISGLLERNGDGSNGVVVRSTLAGREDCIIDPCLDGGVFIFSEKDETGTWTTEGLVSGGGDHITVFKGVILNLTGNETRDVGHLNQNKEEKKIM